MSLKAIQPRLAFIVMAVVIILDQISKILTRAYTELGESFVIWGKTFGETFRFTHLQNTGAAFSLSLPNPTFNRVFFISVSVLAVIFILYLLFKATHRIQVWAFGLVLGGAIGNLIDRILLGGVTDFVDVDFPDFIMYRFPVFNIADSAIFIAMCLLIFDMVFIKDKLPSPAGEEEAASSGNKEIEN